VDAALLQRVVAQVGEMQYTTRVLRQEKQELLGFVARAHSHFDGLRATGVFDIDDNPACTQASASHDAATAAQGILTTAPAGGAASNHFASVLQATATAQHLACHVLPETAPEIGEITNALDSIEYQLTHIFSHRDAIEKQAAEVLDYFYHYLGDIRGSINGTRNDYAQFLERRGGAYASLLAWGPWWSIYVIMASVIGLILCAMFAPCVGIGLRPLQCMALCVVRGSRGRNTPPWASSVLESSPRASRGRNQEVTHAGCTLHETGVQGSCLSCVLISLGMVAALGLGTALAMLSGLGADGILLFTRTGTDPYALLGQQGCKQLSVQTQGIHGDALVTVSGCRVLSNCFETPSTNVAATVLGVFGMNFSAGSPEELAEILQADARAAFGTHGRRSLQAMQQGAVGIAQEVEELGEMASSANQVAQAQGPTFGIDSSALGLPTEEQQALDGHLGDTYEAILNLTASLDAALYHANALSLKADQIEPLMLRLISALIGLKLTFDCSWAPAVWYKLADPIHEMAVHSLAPLASVLFTLAAFSMALAVVLAALQASFGGMLPCRDGHRARDEHVIELLRGSQGGMIAYSPSGSSGPATSVKT
jgi:hypothetical protein